MINVIPTRATFSPAEPVTVELTGELTSVELWHLDTLVAHMPKAAGATTVDFGTRPVGGYGVVARADGRAVATTALDVLERPFDRPRYGFVADYPANHDPTELIDTVRHLHLNLVQFYDWAHRYAQLVPDTETYLDPLGRELSLSTVRAMIEALHGVNSLALGYAAVYAVGGADWPIWEQAGLLTADGEPHRFTDDLLLVVDPANEKWMDHFCGDLAVAMSGVGFDGFHLDSYGWPKRAYRADGSVCDLNEAFATLLTRIAEKVPRSQNMFNNVNDFPTWSTTQAPQDATYIEVWAPHTSLAHLGALAERARGFRKGRPPILAAYLSVYRNAPAEQANAAAQLTMSTIFSHGATHLLNGESNRILVDPYYPSNHDSEPSTREIMTHWYDFLVRYGDLLLAPDAVDVTRSYTGGINEDLVVDAPPGVRFSTDAEPGAIWIRVVRTSLGLIIHLINLTGQTEIGWDTPKQPIEAVLGVKLRALRTLATLAPLAAAPGDDPALTALPVEPEGRYDAITLPPLGAWTMVLLPDPAGWPTPDSGQ